MSCSVTGISMRTFARPMCPLCGVEGELVFERLRDRLFGAGGEWSIRRCVDESCQVLWLDPAPIEDDIGRAYENYFTHGSQLRLPPVRAVATRAIVSGHLHRRLGYASRSTWHHFVAPLALLAPGGVEEIEVDVGFLSCPESGARVLDVGCGSGELVERLRALGWDAEGIDFDLRAVETARSRGLPVRLADARDFGVESGSMDAVHLGHVLEHVYRPAALLRECARVLKPGGRVVVLTPNAVSWGLERFGQDWRGLEPPRHIILYTPQALANLLQKAGFRDVSVRTLVRGARTIFAVSIALRHARLRGLLGVTGIALRWRVAALLCQAIERARCVFHLQCGEEILAMGQIAASIVATAGN